ncbi:hypothetical protein [Kangiella sp. TOML190]|uniref:hypothetical protein n=1 Tax=Kangiella sp. TOML190 TaxID=2931351 RepID=UPI00203ED8A9|nr:hypothetical protein [Kangiella sp. TOML190]
MTDQLAYLDAIGVPRWVLRESAVEVSVETSVEPSTETPIEESLVSKSEVKAPSTAASAENKAVEQAASIYLKALVSNPKAKAAIIAAQSPSKAQLQQNWKQLKFAWKQWQNSEFPVSLYQITDDSSYSLAHLKQQKLVLINAMEPPEQQQSESLSSNSNHGFMLQAPAFGAVGNKKAWWQLLQELQQKIELL